jgi:hypothetical protein
MEISLLHIKIPQVILGVHLDNLFLLLFIINFLIQFKDFNFLILFIVEFNNYFDPIFFVIFREQFILY